MFLSKYIKITRVHLDKSSAVMHIVNSIGSGLDGLAARVLIENCLAMDLIDKKTAALMSAAVSNAVLREVPSEYHNAFRAAVLKQMLMTQV